MRRVLAIGMLLAITGALPAAVAIVHPGIAEPAFTASRIRDLLLGRVTTWKDGQPVVLVLVDQPDCDAEILAIAGRDTPHLLRGWKRLVYTGNGAMPLMAPSLDSAVDLVAGRPGAVVLAPAPVADPRIRSVVVTSDPAH